MGFRDYYRQFDDIDEAALNLERRERRRQEKEAALARAPDIDLSGTEWPDLPHSEIVNAAIARAPLDRAKAVLGISCLNPGEIPCLGLRRRLRGTDPSD